MNQVAKQFQRSPDLIDVLPINANRVVDVGCGLGVIAKEFHIRANPNYYLGIEIVQKNAEIAKQYCSECIVGNIEEFNNETWSQLSNYDLWVFGDVLEHLYDPWSV